MRVLFIVQGEGRGHLTQAISLAQHLQAAGHQVVGAWVNVADGRPVPDFFRQQFSAPITSVAGPLLRYNPATNALDLWATLRGLLSKLNHYTHSMRQLRDAIYDHQPDVVVNFFELLGGLTYGLYRPTVPMVCIGHQCLSLHPTFPFPPGQRVDKLLFKALVRLNTWGATERLGLSFDEQPDAPNQRVRVVPPLLRRELIECQPQPASKPGTAPFVLAYTTQPGLVSAVLKAHQQCPNVPIRYFYPGATKSVEVLDPTLSFWRIDGRRYLSAMQASQAILTTAGFESVCEALYLGKPVMMMPQPRHYEQACNALDGQRAGAGLAANRFDLERLMNYLPHHDPDASIRFRKWQDKAPTMFVAALEQAAYGHVHPTAPVKWRHPTTAHQ